jgi:GxxExxY protein
VMRMLDISLAHSNGTTSKRLAARRRADPLRHRSLLYRPQSTRLRFLEKVYSRAMQVELDYRGHHVVREYPVTNRYRGVDIGRHRLDLLVDNKLVLESKATEQLPRDFTRQLYNCLKATPFEVGLFLHFGRSANFYRIVYRNDEEPTRDTSE